MIDGYLKVFKDKHLYIINYSHKPILDITEFVKDLTIIPLFNGTDEVSFTITMNKKYKQIYDMVQKEIFYLLEDFGFLKTESLSEVDSGICSTKTVTCKSEEYRQFNDRNITLVDTSKSYVSLPLYDGNGGDSILKRLIGKSGEIPSWSVGTIDSTITTNPYTFKDIKKNNILNFVYQNIEETYDCIPFFDSLNHTLSFKKYDNAVEDTGIVLALDTLIQEFGKGCATDTYCTKMYVEGGNLDIRRVNPHGLNYVYNYDGVYDKMSESLRTHLQEWLKACDDYEDEYLVKFAEWSEIQTERDALKIEVNALRPIHQQFWDENGIKSETLEPEEWLADWAERYLQWVTATGYSDKYNRLDYLESIIPKKLNVLEEINIECKREKFLTQEDLIELDMFEIEKSYKQESFAYVDGMTEKEKGEIAYMLKQYAQEEIARCNKPRFNFTAKLSNFCTIKGCEDFADQLNVGKYVRVLDSNGNMYKIIVVKIEANKDEPEDITITFSDKMTGHEHFPQLNEYLNNYMKTIEAQEEINNKLSDIQTQIDKVYVDINTTNNKVNSLFENLPKTASSKDVTYSNLDINSNESAQVLEFYNLDSSGQPDGKVTYNLAKSGGKIVSVVGNGLNMTVSRTEVK